MPVSFRASSAKTSMNSLPMIFRLVSGSLTPASLSRNRSVASDGLDEERGHHGGIHAAGEGQQHLAVAHLRPDGGHLFVDIRLRQFRRVDPLHVLGTDQKLLHTLPPIFDNIT